MKYQILQEGQEGYGFLIEQDAGFVLNEKTAFDLNIKHTPVTEITDPFFINAILQKADTPNKNGRVYPRLILEREVDKYKEYIRQGLAVSEANHPDTSNVDVLNISHLITDIWWEGNTVVGTLRFMTSKGFHDHGGEYNSADRIVNLIRHGVKIGISSRGLGSVKKISGKDHVQDDFELICFDIVTSPSTPGAYLFPAPGGSRSNMKENINNKLDMLNNFLLG